MKNNQTSPETCKTCGRPIKGKPIRAAHSPGAAFCSEDCEIGAMQVEVVEVELLPVTEWEPEDLPVYSGPPPETLRCDHWCECGVRYANEIIVPKRHSLVSICPKCGCVTVD